MPSWFKKITSRVFRRSPRKLRDTPNIPNSKPLSPISPVDTQRLEDVTQSIEAMARLVSRSSTLTSNASAVLQLDLPTPPAPIPEEATAEHEPPYPPGPPRPGPRNPARNRPMPSAPPAPRIPNLPLPRMRRMRSYIDPNGSSPIATTFSTDSEFAGLANPQEVYTNSWSNHYTTKLVIDLTFFTCLYYWILLVRQTITKFFNDARRVARVRAFVTGYWEKEERKEYCLGPVRNPNPEHRRLQGDLIYVVTTEVSNDLKFSLWPTLDVVHRLGVDDDDEWAGGSEYNVVWKPEPREFPGQLQTSELSKVHIAIYVILVLSRALCFIIVQCSTQILPPKTPRGPSIDYEIFAAPTEEMRRELEACGMNIEEEYKPLWQNLIRGPEALKAARRAGFTYDV